ncbi:hypothetical protein DSO57_1021017 [Entomophthora muscae]|uniref:Uncharacterized protein n=1 Tax=Entomophthora muscae TaxID=34485 RepID=A0ACC2S5J5_9FUNG|nr:hypothetical protein DSO57_1021017 [Entomophthora muscae]
MITDIRSNKQSEDLKDKILQGLGQKRGEKTLPTELLYDEAGLQQYGRIMELDEYYLVDAEISILRDKMDEIMEYIPDGATLIELGAGSLSKTKLILRCR